MGRECSRFSPVARALCALTLSLSVRVSFVVGNPGTILPSIHQTLGFASVASERRRQGERQASKQTETKSSDASRAVRTRCGSPVEG